VASRRPPAPAARSRPPPVWARGSLARSLWVSLVWGAPPVRGERRSREGEEVERGMCGAGRLLQCTCASCRGEPLP